MLKVGGKESEPRHRGVMMEEEVKKGSDLDFWGEKPDMVKKGAFPRCDFGSLRQRKKDEN